MFVTNRDVLTDICFPKMDTHSWLQNPIMHWATLKQMVVSFLWKMTLGFRPIPCFFICPSLSWCYNYRSYSETDSMKYLFCQLINSFSQPNKNWRNAEVKGSSIIPLTNHFQSCKGVHIKVEGKNVQNVQCSCAFSIVKERVS